MNIDPFDDRGQFCDKGSSYLGAVFVTTAEERAVAEQSKQKVIEMFPDQTVVTPILDAVTFYPIMGDEIYRQDYYRNNPLRYNYHQRGCERDGFDFPIAMDNGWRTIRAYGVGSELKRFTSVSFLIDQQGIIRFVHDGGEFHLGGGDEHKECQAAYFALKREIEKLLEKKV